VRSADLVARLRRAGCVFAEEEADLLLEAATSPAELERLAAERVAGRPLEQVLGWVAFAGLRVPVVPGVFVPRRRTELLAAEALAVTADEAVVVELCCGAAAISLVLAAGRRDLRLHAADVDPVAVECARANLAGRGQVHTGDLYAALPPALRGTVQVLVANAPYVPTEAIALMPPEARDHEPRVALDGGADGLDVLRRIVAAAPAWLARGGHLLFECGEHQRERALALVRGAGLAGRVSVADELAATVVVARRR
jgi:release factor glutamine methyltransferase